MLKMAMVEKTNGTNKYCEDWLPVKNITNGMIQLENGYFVCGVKVEPKNIFILDEGARNNDLYEAIGHIKDENYEVAKKLSEYGEAIRKKSENKK